MLYSVMRDIDRSDVPAVDVRPPMAYGPPVTSLGVARQGADHLPKKAAMHTVVAPDVRQRASPASPGCRPPGFPTLSRFHKDGSVVSATFTQRQGEYLAFIYYYAKINGRPPAESDIQRYFGVTAPTVHQMIVALEAAKLIQRRPGMPRSIEVLVPRADLPDLA